MANVVSATYGAIAKNVILSRALADAEAGMLEPDQVDLIKKVCEDKQKAPAPLLLWLEGLMPGVSKTIAAEINQTAQDMLADMNASMRNGS